jgi:hypothetical protein
MRKLIAWEIGVVAFVAFVHVLVLICGFKPLFGVIVSEIAILAFLAYIIFNMANSEAFTTVALAFATASLALVFFVPIIVVMISCISIAVLAFLAAIVNTSEFRVKYRYVFSSLVAEAGIIFTIFRYSHILLGK